MTERFDHVVVGAGIIGLTTAIAIREVSPTATIAIVEADPRARSATVRNFGMIWPVGQPLGDRYEIARRSAERWLLFAERAGIEARLCGSLHLAYHESERAVLGEFAAMAGPKVATLISSDDAVRRASGIRVERLLGALWSPHEVSVDPRSAAAGLARWLEAEGVTFIFGEAVTVVEPGQVETSARAISAGHVWLCPGVRSDLPLAAGLATAGMQPVYLHMLRAKRGDAPPDAGPGPHLCAGLTLLHYVNFADCPSLPALRERFTTERPDAIRHGIHILVAEHADRSFTIGDSHHGEPEFLYRQEAVDDAIFRYTDEFLPVASLRITERWEGVYGRHPTAPYLALDPAPGVTVLGAFGGAGMTLSFGVTEREVRARLT